MNGGAWNDKCNHCHKYLGEDGHPVWHCVDEFTNKPSWFCRHCGSYSIHDKCSDKRCVQINELEAEYSRLHAALLRAITSLSAAGCDAAVELARDALRPQRKQ